MNQLSPRSAAANSPALTATRGEPAPRYAITFGLSLLIRISGARELPGSTELD